MITLRRPNGGCTSSPPDCPAALDRLSPHSRRPGEGVPACHGCVVPPSPPPLEGRRGSLQRWGETRSGAARLVHSSSAHTTPRLRPRCPFAAPVVARVVRCRLDGWRLGS